MDPGQRMEAATMVLIFMVQVCVLCSFFVFWEQLKSKYTRVLPLGSI